ncbi:hypothetical protein ACFVYJ_03020 [Pontibacter sp. JAM-7]|uniref:hypothetical protein n=1 Tax=Pontibacter sp. JAM-7 TaxID=3366581 RepID=UPI003AF7D858
MKAAFWRRWLERRVHDPRRNLALLGIGFALFALGMAALVVAEFMLASSLSQELMALLGLIIAALGSILAATGYLSLSVFRLLHFVSKKDDH